MKVVSLSALYTGRLYPPEGSLVLISVRGRVDFWAGRIKSIKKSHWIEPATFRVVAQCFNQLRYYVPNITGYNKGYHHVTLILWVREVCHSYNTANDVIYKKTHWVTAVYFCAIQKLYFHYAIWKLLVATSCRLLYPYHLSPLSRPRPPVRRRGDLMWQRNCAS
jgi:hypothetical protein